MEISVSVPDVTDAQNLVQVLDVVLDATVSYDVGRQEIRVRSGSESDRAILPVVDAVDSWLEQGCARWAKLSLGERSYTLIGGGQVASLR